MRGSFQETAPRKTAEHTVKHRDGGVGSVVANHHGVGESSVVVTTLCSCSARSLHLPPASSELPNGARYPFAVACIDGVRARAALANCSMTIQRYKMLHAKFGQDLVKTVAAHNEQTDTYSVLDTYI